MFIPLIKVSTLKLPKWFNPEIKHLLNHIHTLKCKLKRSSNATNLASLSSLELELQELMSNAKEDYKVYLLTSFQHNPKVHYCRIRHLSKFLKTPQCLVYTSSSVLDPIDKVEAFNQLDIRSPNDDIKGHIHSRSVV